MAARPCACALALLACAATRAAAWGAPGHMTTAALAQRHLTDGAAAAATADLTAFKSLYPTESEFVTAADWCAHGAARARA